MATQGKLPNTTNHNAASAAITAASTAHELNSVFSDTEVETALNDLGTAINSLITVLENYGLVKKN